MHPGPSRLARDPLQDSDSAEKPPSQPTFVILAIGYGDAPELALGCTFPHSFDTFFGEGVLLAKRGGFSAESGLF
jgi:hypothetical protein